MQWEHPTLIHFFFQIMDFVVNNHVKLTYLSVFLDHQIVYQLTSLWHKVCFLS